VNKTEKRENRILSSEYRISTAFLVFNRSLIHFRAYATSYVRLSVTLVIAVTLSNKQWKWAHDRIGQYLGYYQPAEADPDRSIL